MCYCGRILNAPELVCNTCKKSVHITCEQIHQMNLATIRQFFCTPCENRTGIITKYQRKRYTILKQEYYEVDQILYHRGEFPDTQFLIQWKDFSSAEATWEPASYLLDCPKIVSQYLVANNLDHNKLLGVPSLYDNRPYDKSLAILRLLYKYTETHHEDNPFKLKIGIYTSKPETDEISILIYDNHYYVILYIKNRHKHYITDGENNYGFRRDIRESINKTLGFKVKCLSFIHHPSNILIDTAAIVLTYYQCYRNRRIPIHIEPSQNIYSRLESLD